MFWESFQGGIVSQIDALLDSESVTLKELMDEDDILQECKASNQKLLSFLTRPEVMEEMVTLITTEPPEDPDERNRYKKANIACELLTSDVSSVNDALVASDSLLNKLYLFLSSEKQLNPLLASFFSKTMNLLCVKRCEILFEFLQTKEDFVTLMLNHIETSAIMDFLLKLITGTDDIALRASVVKWLHEKHLIEKLVSIFRSGFSPEAQANAAQFLCDMIKACRDHQSLLQDKAEQDSLLADIESTSRVSELLSNVFSARTESSIVNGINVLQSLLEYKRHCANIQQQQTPFQSNIQTQGADFDGIPQCLAHPLFNRNDLMAPDQMTALDVERLSRSVRQVHAAIIPHLKEFHSVLLSPPDKAPVRTTIGTIDKPLGATRLEVVHLIRAVLSSNNPEVNEKIQELQTVPVLIDLFFYYPWNNFLHTQVEQTIKCILNNAKSNSPVTSPISNDDPNVEAKNVTVLVEQLFKNCNLIERLLNVWSEHPSNGTSPTSTPRPGFMGHIIKIANHIVDNKEEAAVKTELSSLSAELAEKWNSFVNGPLGEINKRIQTPLVNEMPSATSFENNTRQQENALQQAFIEYQMQQMTRTLCTQIEFSATQFTEQEESIQPQVDHLSKISFNLENQLQESSKAVHIFEQMCAERAKASLDGSSSDEDELWEDRDLTFSRSSTDSKKLSKEVIDHTGFMADVKMDVDQNETWHSSDIGATSSPQFPECSRGLDGVDPWSVCKPKEENSEQESWADFSSFSSTEFNTLSGAPPNTCVTSSTIMPSSSDVPLFNSDDSVVMSTGGGPPSLEPAECVGNDGLNLNSGTSIAADNETGTSAEVNPVENVLNGPH